MEILFWIAYVIIALMMGNLLTRLAIHLPNNVPNVYGRPNSFLFYLLGILLTLVIFILIPITFGLTKELLIAYPFSMIMITLTLTDLKYQIIPNKIIYPGIVLILALRLFINPLPLWSYLLGGAIFGGLILLIAIISRGGMGGGDIKLFFLVGLALGLQNALLAFFISSFAGAIVGGGLLLFRKVKAKQLIPYGPFIFVGAMTAYFFGDIIWAWYLS